MVFTVYEWTLDVRRLLHARSRRCQIARRAGDMSELQDRDKQNVGVTEPRRREGCFRVAGRMSILRQGVSTKLTRTTRGLDVR